MSGLRVPIALRSARARRGGATSGITVIEISVAVALLAVGLGTAVYALIGATTLQRSAAERALALRAAESVLESIQAEPFDEAFVRFNAITIDDPADGASPGDAFAVVGLQPWVGDADGLPGEVLFPGGNVQLLENVVDAEFGMPRDLTLDEPPVIDGDDHADGYRVLPVRVRVRWRGVVGDCELTIGTTLNNERKVENEP